jgi:multidrug efflux pump subunit AcrB
MLTAVLERKDRLDDHVRFPEYSAAGNTSAKYTPLVARIDPINTPTEVDHYQIRRVIDVYVMPESEDLSGVNSEVTQMLKGLTLPRNARVRVQGAVVGMSQSFTRFGVGLLLSVILVYLILMAQFRSFIEPFIILTAIPPGLAGALVFLWMTHTTLNTVVDGSDHDDRDRCVQQHSDCGVFGNLQERG